MLELSRAETVNALATPVLTVLGRPVIDRWTAGAFTFTTGWVFSRVDADVPIAASVANSYAPTVSGAVTVLIDPPYPIVKLLFDAHENCTTTVHGPMPVIDDGRGPAVAQVPF